MHPIRAPSTATLRALRSLAFPSSSCPTSTTSNCLRQNLLHLPVRCAFSSSHQRTFTTSAPTKDQPYTSPRSTRNRYAPKSHDRGPESAEDTQTDFSKMDIFNTSNVAAPATSIDACTSDGFHLNNNLKVTNYDGVLLVGGEAFAWSPHKHQSGSDDPGHETRTGTGKQLLDARGTINFPKESLGLLEVLSPKPDLLLLGTGSRLWMLGKQTREYLNTELGIRVDVMDTANASSAYNLLAQERGVDGGSSVGAALLPLGWKGR